MFNKELLMSGGGEENKIIEGSRFVVTDWSAEFKAVSYYSPLGTLFEYKRYAIQSHESTSQIDPIFSGLNLSRFVGAKYKKDNNKYSFIEITSLTESLMTYKYYGKYGNTLSQAGAGTYYFYSYTA